MKRKITKIGTLLASVALMFGATSWANAHENDVTITFSANAEFTGFVDATIEGADAETAKIAGTSVTAPTTATISKKSVKSENYEKVGAVGVTEYDFVGIDPAAKGDGDASAFTFTVEAKNGYAFVADEVYFEAMKFGTDANKKNIIRYRPIHDGVKYYDSKQTGDILRDNANNTDTNAPWQVTVTDGLGEQQAVKFQFKVGPGSEIANGKQVGIRNIKITGHFVEHQRVNVAYVAAVENTAEGKHPHPVLDALQEDTWNFNAELVVKDATKALDPAEFEVYDVVLLGGNASSSSEQGKSIFAFAGKKPFMNVTKAFCYKNGWGAGANPDANVSSNFVVPDRYNATHPIFSGIESDTIFVFQADYKDHLTKKGDYADNGKKEGQVMQGFTTNASAPVHTVLGTSGKLNVVGEAWTKTEAGDSIPYLFIGYDNDLIVNSDSTIQLTADAAKLYRNAVMYLDTAKAQYVMSMIGDLDKDKTTKLEFAQVKSPADGGATMEDTLRYVVKLSMDSVYKDMSMAEKTMPNVKITLGSETKDYDFDKPDTIWKPSSVKLVATADYYFGEVTIDTTFENKLLPKVEMPDTTWTLAAGTEADYVLSFDEIKTLVDGEETPTTIYYSFDGTTYKKYDADKLDTVWKTTVVWAYAEAYLHANSDTLKEAKWTNPTLPVIPKPTIEAKKTDKPGCVYSVTITAADGTPEGATIYYTLDGTLPTTASTVYNEPFEIPGYDEVKVSAIVGNVDRYGDSDSALCVVLDPEADKYKFTAPKITLEGNGFTIEATNSAEYATLYYTTNGEEPTETNALVYTGKVTYLAGEYTVKAIAAAEGFVTSPVATETLTVTGEVPMFAKTLYQSTFNADDPSQVLAANGDYSWGWYRWVSDGADGWIKGSGGSTSPTTKSEADKYIPDEEFAKGVYYDDDKGRPRAQIFPKSNKVSEWRTFNNWAFWSDLESNNTHRIMLQYNSNAKGVGALVDADSNYVATGGAIYITGNTAKVALGPDSLLKGPFTVVVNVAGGGTGGSYNADVDIDVCLTNGESATSAREMKIGTVHAAKGSMGTDTIRYLGDEELYVRLTSKSKEYCIYDFIVYKEGIDLPPLAIDSITPMGGSAESSAVEMEAADLNTFTVYFNHDILEGAGKVEWTSGPSSKLCQTSVSGNVLTITLPEGAPKVEGKTYGLYLPADCVTDADNQSLSGGVFYYYTIKAASAVDEVSAAKEVVAKHIYSISGAEIPALKQGVNIVKTIYNDGSVTTEKVQVK